MSLLSAPIVRTVQHFMLGHKGTNPKFFFIQQKFVYFYIYIYIPVKVIIKNISKRGGGGGGGLASFFLGGLLEKGVPLFSGGGAFKPRVKLCIMLCTDKILLNFLPDKQKCLDKCYSEKN